MLNSVIAIVNSFVGDLARRDKIQHSLLVESSNGLGICLAHPLLTEVLLLILALLDTILLIFGLPILILQLRDYCLKYNIKEDSRQLRLQHEAENLRDIRYLSNRAVEEEMARRAFGEGYMESSFMSVNPSMVANPSVVTNPPTAANRCEIGSSLTRTTSSVSGLNFLKNIQAEESKAHVQSKAGMVKKARERIEKKRNEEMDKAKIAGKE